MALACEELIRRALRRVQDRGLGPLAPVDEPTAAEFDAALSDLQSLYDGWITSGGFGRAVDMQIGTDHTLEEGERVFNTTDDPVALTLPESVADATGGQDRPPRDYTLARVAGEPPQTYIWSAPRGAWVRMTSLALADAAPLAERDANGLAACLAEVIAGPGAVARRVATQAKHFRTAISIKFDRPAEPGRPDYF